MSTIEPKLNSLDEHIPDYVLGKVDEPLRQQIEELMQRDKRFEKQVHVEQALAEAMTREANTSSAETASFDVLRQRIKMDGDEQKTNSFLSNRSLPVIAAAVLFTAIALPLLVQNTDKANNEFEALSAPASAPAQEQRLLRVIFSDGISEHRRKEIAAQYNLEVFEAAGALNSIVYKLPTQTHTEQLLNALKQEKSVEFVALTSASK